MPDKAGRECFQYSIIHSNSQKKHPVSAPQAEYRMPRGMSHNAMKGQQNGIIAHWDESSGHKNKYNSHNSRLAAIIP